MNILISKAGGALEHADVVVENSILAADWSKVKRTRGANTAGWSSQTVLVWACSAFRIWGRAVTF